MANIKPPKLNCNRSATIREFKGANIKQRADGYLDATAMCQATGKLFGNYRQIESTQQFLQALSTDIGYPISAIIQSVKGGNPQSQGTWVHPQVAINLAQWCSPEFAVLVSRWVFELIATGSVDIKPKPSLRPGGSLVSWLNQQAEKLIALDYFVTIDGDVKVSSTGVSKNRYKTVVEELLKARPDWEDIIMYRQAGLHLAKIAELIGVKESRIHDAVKRLKEIGLLPNQQQTKRAALARIVGDLVE